MTPPLTNDFFAVPGASVRPASSPIPSTQKSPKGVELPPSPRDAQHDVPKTAAKETEGQTQSDPTSTISSPAPAHHVTLQLPYRPRNQSPSGQPRPHSSGGVTAMPLMQRAHSSPGVDSSGRYITPGYSAPRRPSSPLNSGRRRSPLRSAAEDAYPGAYSWSGLNIEPNIPEHAELELSADNELSQHSPSAFSNTFPRSKRRPTSPLHQSASAPSLHARSVSPSTSGGTSPSLAAQKYANEPYPVYSFSSASSMPSTPTSLRSRSPSISSLETIEDIPDAEEAARLEAEEAKQRGEDGEGSTDLRRRSSLELRGSALRSNKERKRWSVCGAERRADFSLEPIEE